MTADDLHRALDGIAGDPPQTIRVASMIVAKERRWIQIELVGPFHYTLLVSADLRRDPQMIRAALQSWITGDWTADAAAVSGVMVHNATIRTAGRLEG
jgi:hypothetical protein